MASTVRIRVSTSTRDALTLIATIRGKEETPGQIASIATDLLLEAVKQSIEGRIDINDKIILDYISRDLATKINNL